MREIKNATAFSRAMSDAIHGGLLANGFDLSTASVAGAIIIGPEGTIRSLPHRSLDVGFQVLQENMVGAGVFSGVYADDRMKGLRIYTLFGGLDLPVNRVQELSAQAEVEWGNLSQKLGSGPQADPFAGLSFMGEGKVKLERGQGLPQSKSRQSIFGQLAS